MKYAPRKVFILESGSYIELTYEEFCRRKEADESYQNMMFIPVQGYLMETDPEQYKAFYREKERNAYLERLDKENGLLSIDAFDSEDDNGTDFISADTEDIADLVADSLMAEKLQECLPLLTEDEQRLIREIYFTGLTERDLAEKYHISQVAVHKRKHRILEKLKKLLEN